MRRVHMQAMLKSIGIDAEYVPAVDGRKLTRAERARYDAAAATRVYGCHMSESEIGCCLSHLAVTERMVRENIACALVLEDDVVCGPDLVSVVNELCSKADPEWLLVRLETQKPVLNNPVSRRTRGRLTSRLQRGGLYRMERGVLGAGACLVRREAAQRLLDQGSRLCMPFDQMLDRYWENGIVPFLVRPLPARQVETLHSEIGLRGRALGEHASVLRMAMRRVQRARDALDKRLFWGVYASKISRAAWHQLGADTALNITRAAARLTAKFG
jgi:glycosyl transferase family 25